MFGVAAQAAPPLHGDSETEGIEVCGVRVFPRFEASESNVVGLWGSQAWSGKQPGSCNALIITSFEKDTVEAIYVGKPQACAGARAPSAFKVTGTVAVDGVMTFNVLCHDHGANVKDIVTYMVNEKEFALVGVYYVGPHITFTVRLQHHDFHERW